MAQAHEYTIERWQRALDAAKAGVVDLSRRLKADETEIEVLAADQLAALAESLPED